MSEEQGEALEHDTSRKVGYGTALAGLVDSGLGVFEGLEHAEAVPALAMGYLEEAPNLLPGLGILGGGLGVMGGALEMKEAGEQLGEGNLNGVTTAAKGAASFIGGGSSMIGTMAGYLGASGLAGGAASVAGVMGAAGAGLAVGSGMAAASDSDYTRTGFWGRDEEGGAKSATDWANDAGIAANGALGLAPDNFLGANVSAAAGIAAAPVATYQTIMNWMAE